jgi:hypothetical protein
LADADKFGVEGDDGAVAGFLGGAELFVGLHLVCTTDKLACSTGCDQH